MRLSQLPCQHGAGIHRQISISFQFSKAFLASFVEAISEGCENSPFAWIVDARNATLDEFSAVWNDSAKMEMAMSYLLRGGAQEIRAGKYDHARQIANIIRYLEQHIAVQLHQTQALYNWPKLTDIYFSDVHALVKFFRHRIPCSCSDGIYEKVKFITKVGLCFNPQCTIPVGELERRKAKYCSRCRCVTYCSIECQRADWARHKANCDGLAAIKAKFEVNQHNMLAVVGSAEGLQSPAR